VITPAFLGRIATLGRDLRRLFGPGRHTDVDPRQTDEWLRIAVAARQEGRHGDALDFYQRVLGRRPGDPVALRALREAALAAGRPEEAISAQQLLLNGAARGDRSGEAERLASLHYEVGRAELERGRAEPAIQHLRSALRVNRDFVPATVALGDAQMSAGDAREAVRTWERAVDSHPSLPLLARLERAHRQEGRPSRMIALYRRALERAPDDLSFAVALGRVYLELEMLDEAADQLERVEVRAPDLPVVHAYLAAVFERRGEWQEACAEYRRALQLGHVFDWPHRCESCGTMASGWHDRCPTCRRWNSLRPTRS
jgi:lipopolysaccharide biosynthesis regulator YciM